LARLLRCFRPFGATKFLLFGLLALVCARPVAASTLYVQPVQVCETATTCADSTSQLYEAITEAIWAQAGIDIVFLDDWITITNTSLYSVGNSADTETIFSDSLVRTPSYTIAMWFVDSITYCGGTVTAYGCSVIGGDDVIISDLIFSDSRTDTIAHELGHILGLSDCCSSSTFDLMNGSGSRTNPTTVADVSPSGKNLDQLTTAEISVAKTSSLLEATPEPGTALLLLSGLPVLYWMRRRIYLRRGDRASVRAGL